MTLAPDEEGGIGCFCKGGMWKCLLKTFKVSSSKEWKHSSQQGQQGTPQLVHGGNGGLLTPGTADKAPKGVEGVAGTGRRGSGSWPLALLFPYLLNRTMRTPAVLLHNGLVAGSTGPVGAMEGAPHAIKDVTSARPAKPVGACPSYAAKSVVGQRMTMEDRCVYPVGVRTKGLPVFHVVLSPKLPGRVPAAGKRCRISS